MSNSILKSLIGELVESYLEESYEDDLVESIFEEVSEETWEAIQEAILNELSPELLKRYHQKAGNSLGHAMDKYDNAYRDKDKASAQRIIDKRNAGRSAARKASGVKGRSTLQKNKDAREMSSDEFERKYKETKKAWKEKHQKEKFAANPSNRR